MRMLEVMQFPEGVDMQDVLNFLTIKMKTFFGEAPETFLLVKSRKLFLRKKVHIEIFKFYIYKLMPLYNTCMLKTQVTIYYFMGNIDDKMNL